MKRKTKFLSAAIVFAVMLMIQIVPAYATDGPSAVISAGHGVTFAIAKDSSLWGYGKSENGLGADSATTVTTPVKIMDVC